VKGRLHFFLKSGFSRLRVVGESGTVYKGTFQEKVSLNGVLDADGQTTITFTQQNLVVSTGSGPNDLAHITSHLTINGNGEITAEVSNFFIECVG
jgi:hypothetical protein